MSRIPKSLRAVNTAQQALYKLQNELIRQNTNQMQSLQQRADSARDNSSRPSISGNLSASDRIQQELYDAHNDIITQNTKHEIQMLHIQQRADRERETSVVRSNLQKAHHDVMMMIAANMK